MLTGNVPDVISTFDSDADDSTQARTDLFFPSDGKVSVRLANRTSSPYYICISVHIY